MELLFIRHGQTDWNAKRRIMGRRPVPLNDFGREQAERLAGYLSGADLRAVITSPVVRARETADIIASRQDGLDVETDEGLTPLRGCEGSFGRGVEGAL